MENSKIEQPPAWMNEPFGPGWEEVAQHVDTIVEVWASPVWQGTPVSEQTQDQLVALTEAVTEAEAIMRQTWSAAAWANHQAAIQGRALPPEASLGDRIAHFEYRLVQAWQAQQVHAYWDQLSPDERARQQTHIQEVLSDLPPLSSHSPLPQ